jgi:hypothetical protein
MSDDGHSNELLETLMHTFQRHISQKRSLEILNFSLLRNIASSALFSGPYVAHFKNNDF